jgi:hypothetical protein
VITVRCCWLSLCLLTLICNPVVAGRNASGAMVLHTDDMVTFSAGQDYCSIDPLPAACSDLVTQIDKDPGIEAVVWIVASFPPYASPGASAFQVGIYGSVPRDYFTAWAPCGPGFLEIPDATWPEPGTGTAVAYTSTVYSTLFKMYWFAVSAPGTGSTLSTGDYPGGDHHAEWADDSYPPQVDRCDLFGSVGWGVPGHDNCWDPTQTGACCFPNCSCRQLLPDECESDGGTFIGPQIACAPNPCPCPPGACCLRYGACEDVVPADCDTLGGTWEGAGTTCATFQCPNPPGSCCFSDCTCQMLTWHECHAMGGVWYGSSDCDPNPCPCPPGACCMPDGACQQTTQSECDAMSGAFQGIGTVCSPNPCAPSPTRVTTWGRIKGAFR